MIFRFCLVLMFFISALFSVSQTYEDSPSDFFFPDEVSEVPKMMSPGLISTGMNEQHGTFSPEGDEFYYSLTLPDNVSVIVETKFSGGFWSHPEVLSFTTEYLNSSPFVSPDGQYLYFASDRPGYEEDGIPDWNIWRCARLGNDTWSEPELLSFCSEERNEMSVSIDENGMLYFHADYASETITVEPSFFDIFRVKENEDGSWNEVEKLDSSVNSDAMEQTPGISSDGETLIFSSVRPEEGHKSEDLYVSFKTPAGWSDAVNMGHEINSAARECCPVFVPGRDLILFTSYARKRKPGEISYREVKKWVLGPGNGAGDIWFVNVSVLENLKAR